MQSGAAMPLARFALDTGFATQEAYAFVRACRDPRLMAVKGVARGAALVGTPTAVDVTQGGKKLRRGIKVFSVAVGIAKLEFYNNLRKGADVAEDGVTTSPTRPASCICPRSMPSSSSSCAPSSWSPGATAMALPIREWQKMRERNEALDCYVYARAAASAAGLDRFEERHWRELERQLRPEQDGAAAASVRLPPAAVAVAGDRPDQAVFAVAVPDLSNPSQSGRNSGQRPPRAPPVG